MSQARGRAYKCLNCGHTNEKRRVISHIYKEHVRLDEAPFYCKVCLFRCTDEESLRRHVRPDVYPAHHQRMSDIRMQGTILEPHKILMRSLKPKHLEEGLDYLRLTAKESDCEWQKRRKNESGLAAAASLKPASSENLLDRLLDYNPDEPLTPTSTFVSPPAPSRLISIPKSRPTCTATWQLGEFHSDLQATPTRDVDPYIPLPASSVEAMNMSVRYQPTPITDSYIATPLPTPLPTAQPIHLSTCAAATSQQLAFSSPVAAVPVFGGQISPAVSSSLPQAMPILQSCTTEVISGPSFPLISTFPSILSATITPTSTLSPMRTTSLAASTSTTSVITSKTTATMTETSSSSTGTLPSVQPAGADPLVQALSTFSNTLVEAIQQQTFQIGMLRHTMSAILQRMEDRDSARQPAPAQSSSPERRSRLSLDAYRQRPSSSYSDDKAKKRPISSSLGDQAKRLKK